MSGYVRDFAEIEREAQKEENLTRQFEQMVKSNTEYVRYENNRKEDKQFLKEMVYFYKGFAEDDPDFAKILNTMSKLAAFDTTSESKYQYNKEVGTYRDLIKAMEKYDEILNAREKALQEEAEKKLKKKAEDGTEVWMSEEEIAKNPELMKVDMNVNVGLNDVENKRRMNMAIMNYMIVQRDGKLLEPSSPENGEEPVRVINSVGKNFSIADQEMGGVARFVQNLGIGSSWKDTPLFPHEPNMNDVRQGMLGDCFYMAALQNVVRLNPDFIKEAMRDNQDGTVTVRLYSKIKEGEYKPIHVVVEKKVIQYGGLVKGGGENCLWVTCFERALAASGLYSAASASEKF